MKGITLSKRMENERHYALESYGLCHQALLRCMLNNYPTILHKIQLDNIWYKKFELHRVVNSRALVESLVGKSCRIPMVQLNYDKRSAPFPED